MTDHQLDTRARIVRSLKAKKAIRRTSSEKIADWCTLRFGTMGFLMLNALVFTFWIIINRWSVLELPPFDPFPFGLLTMIVSLEAIILSIFVLISQNRAEKIDDLRDEIDLQVDLITEREITKTLKLLSLLAAKNGVDLPADEELQEMIKPADIGKIERDLEKRVF